MIRTIIAGMVILLLGACGGAVKRRTQLDVPSTYEFAQTASLQELVKLINSNYAAIQALAVSSLKMEFVSGSVEKGYLEEYRTAKAYTVAQAPGSVFMNILNPLTNSSVITMAASGDTFQIWIPRENKYVMGKTSVKIQDDNPIYNVRPHHLLPGLLVESIPVEGGSYRYFLEEEQDNRFKYYVISVIHLEKVGDDVKLLRKLWIERSMLRLTRQHYYDSGEIISVIRYAKWIEIDGTVVSTEIQVERKRENYRVGFEFMKDAIRVNPSIKEGAFQVPRPSGAELVVVESS